MSKFNVGDRVRVVSITDIDADLDSPDRVITDRETAAGVYGGIEPLPGDTAVVTATYCDYYDVSIRLDRESDGNDEYAMIDADLELIK